jgi:hypothetical protein
MVPQDPAIALYRDTVADELRESLRLRRLPSGGADVRRVLERWRISDLAERHPRDLSVGQQQRVAIAAMLAHEPPTWLLDEPTRGADLATKSWLAERFREHAAAGGATPYYNLDVDETEDAIKATAGKLFWIHVMNLSAAKLYIKFYNATTANVTVGTTTPVLSFPVPTMADTNGAGFAIHFGDVGVQFDTAITVAATTGLADNSTGAPGANEVVLNAGFL